jgi:hypothetical protein
MSEASRTIQTQLEFASERSAHPRCLCEMATAGLRIYLPGLLRCVFSILILARTLARG